MDEILRAPHKELPFHRPRKDHTPAGGQGERVERLKEQWAKRMEQMGELRGDLAIQSTRIYHRAHSAVAGKPKMARAARLIASTFPFSSSRIRPSAMQSRIRETLSRSSVMDWI